MAEDKTDRKGFLLHIHKTCVPVAAKDNTVTDLVKLLEVLEVIYKSGAHFIELLSDGGIGSVEGAKPKTKQQLPHELTRGLIYIGDFSYDKLKKTCTILFVKADASVANPAFIDAANNTVRVSKAKKGEAVGFSAHLVISLDPKHITSKGHRAVFEKARNLSRSLMLTYLSHLFHVYSKDNHLNYVLKGKKSTRPYRVDVSCIARASASLKKDIKEGYVTMLELYNKSSDYGGWDSLAQVNKASQRVKLAVSFKKSAEDFIPFFDKISKEAKSKGFDEISVKIGGLKGDGTATPRFSLEKENAADILYSRIVPLGNFEKPLEQCYAEIHTGIEEKLIKAITSTENW